MDSANFNTRLKELMENSTPKTTQQDLAQILKVTRQQISNYTTGKTSPDPNTICTLAKYFDVSTDYLLGMSDIKSADIDSKKINQMLGLSEKTIDRLKSDMDLLYKVTRKTTPDEATAIYKQFIEFVQEGHKKNEIANFAKSVGICDNYQENGIYYGWLSFMGKFFISDIVNELVNDDERAENVFSIAWTLNDLLNCHTKNEYFSVKELCATEDCFKQTGSTFLISQNDVFNIYLLRLQEAFIKRKNHATPTNDKD